MKILLWYYPCFFLYKTKGEFLIKCFGSRAVCWSIWCFIQVWYLSQFWGYRIRLLRSVAGETFPAPSPRPSPTEGGRLRCPVLADVPPPPQPPPQDKPRAGGGRRGGGLLHSAVHQRRVTRPLSSPPPHEPPLPDAVGGGGGGGALAVGQVPPLPFSSEYLIAPSHPARGDRAVTNHTTGAPPGGGTSAPTFPARRPPTPPPSPPLPRGVPMAEGVYQACWGGGGYPLPVMEVFRNGSRQH